MEDYVYFGVLIKMRQQLGFKAKKRITLNRAMKWFEKKYHLAISIVWRNGWYYSVRNMDNIYADREIVNFNSVYFNSRKSAINAALLAAINIVKKSV